MSLTGFTFDLLLERLWLMLCEKSHLDPFKQWPFLDKNGHVIKCLEECTLAFFLLMQD